MQEKSDLRSTKEISFSRELTHSFISYSMSVIVGRALADVRDGLKPSQRRIIYSMFESKTGQQFTKCARIVGLVMGNYHPHADDSIYGALVRLAQEFNYRHNLIEGQGNFGSIDGDVAGAHRYTEARLAPIASKLLEDIEFVDYEKNYDSSCYEPKVLSASFPSVLINGTEGIAVGFSARVPPHNLAEVVDAVVAYLDGEDLTGEKAADYFAPDFPQGGIIDRNEVASVYKNGRGIIRIYPVIDYEMQSQHHLIVIKSLPHSVNKMRVIKDISEKVNEGKIMGIEDIFDDSHGLDIRVCVKVKRGFEKEVVANQIRTLTEATYSFGCNFALLNKTKLKTYTPAEIIDEFLIFRRETIRRKYVARQNTIKAKLTKLFGIYVILEAQVLTEMVAALMKTGSQQEAQACLKSFVFDASDLKPWAFPEEQDLRRFSLNEEQISNLLNTKLQSVTRLEKEKTREEIESLKKELKNIEAILSSTNLIDEIIKAELLELKNRFGLPRQTQIVDTKEVFGDLEVIHDDEVAILLTNFGRITVMSVRERIMQARGGKGKNFFKSSFLDGEYVRISRTASIKQKALFFTASGRVFSCYLYSIGKCAPVNIADLLPIGSDTITSVLCLEEEVFEDENKHLIMVTHKGYIKRNPLSLFMNIPRKGKIAIKLSEGDEVLKAIILEGEKTIALFTTNGKMLPIMSQEVRTSSGRNSSGVRGIKLAKGDSVTDIATVVDNSDGIIVITQKGFGKLIGSDELEPRTRNTVGIICVARNRLAKTGKMVCALNYNSDIQDIGIFTTQGKVIFLNPDKMRLRIQSRSSQGARLMNLEENNVVCDLAAGLPSAFEEE